MAQLKAMFKDSWENITGNCDTFLYLGGNEQGTFKYVSELLGKETIDTRTRSQSRGRNGSSSTNYQQSGRELLTPDEVRTLDQPQRHPPNPGRGPGHRRQVSPGKAPKH